LVTPVVSLFSFPLLSLSPSSARRRIIGSEDTSSYFRAPGYKKAFEKELEKYVHDTPETSGHDGQH
jgi:hypothetical protein